MSSSNMTSCILKGCNSKFINSLAMSSFHGKDINESIKNKAVIIAESYDIKECINIIANYGDFHHVYVQLQLNPQYQIDVSNKLIFHKQIAYLYIKEIIQTKVKIKIDELKLKRRIAIGNGDMTCPICFENVEKDGLITQCNHVFHKNCMTRWGKNICPMCRGNI